MKDFVIELLDKGTGKKDYLVLSDKDLLEIRREAGRNPVSPLIVRRMEGQAIEKSYNLAGLKKQLFRVARDILVGRERQYSIVGRSLEQDVPAIAAVPRKDAATDPGFLRQSC